VSHEEVEAVPHDGDCEARAHTPHAVVSRKDHDRHVNECLEKVKEAKLWND